MQTVNVDVKVKDQLVGTASVPVFDSISEAETYFGSPEKLLKAINRHAKTVETNKIRVKAAGDTAARKISRIGRQLASKKITNEDAASLLKTLLEQVSTAQ